jgi:hypothetical protein
MQKAILRGFEELYEGGKPRLGWARTYFLEGNKEPALDELVEFYRCWRNYVEYGVLQRQVWNGKNVEKKTIAVKCAKRGNDVYRRRIEKRMAVFELAKGDVEFFSFNNANPKVSMVFVTLTWVGQGPVSESWEKIGEYFNRWITNLREKYGKISYARTWEATQKGYAHVHVMLLFHDAVFHGFKTVDDEGNFVWRISEKEEFEKSWPAFVDARAVRTYSSVLRYLRKRIVEGTDKEDNEEGGDLTLALTWIFRKRSFALSRDLSQKLSDLIRDLRNSKRQLTLKGEFVEEVWVWLGVWGAGELGLDGSVWCVELEKPPT